MPPEPLARRYIRKYGFAVLATSMLFLSLIARQLDASHAGAREAAVTEAENLALVLEAKLSADFEAAHSAVLAMASDVDPAALRRKTRDPYDSPISKRLQTLVRNIHSASALRYFDADGELLYSSIPSNKVNISDRAYFQAARSAPASVVFSEVIQARTDGQPIVAVAKAILDRDGNFIGLATAAINVRALHEEFSRIELGEQSTIILRRIENGAAVVIHPGPVKVDNAPAPGIVLRRTILSSGPTGVVEFDSPVDGIRRIYGYRTVSNFPFFVAVGIAEKAYLAQWRRDLASTLLASLLFVAVLVSVFYLLARAESMRDRNEQARRITSRRLEAVFAALTEGMIFHDRNGVIIDANPAAEQLLGRDRDSLLGMDLSDPRWHIVAEDNTPVRPDQHPAMITLRTGKVVRNQVLGVATADGLRWLNISAAPVSGPGENGLPDSVVTTFHDISDSKQASTELRIAATAFQTREGMMVTDRHGVILRVNHAFTAITGFPPEDVIGKTPRMLRSGYHDDAFYRAMWDAVRDRGGWQGEIRDRRKNGELFPAWLTITAVKDDAGHVTHYVGTHTDITRRKNAEIAMLNLNHDLRASQRRLRLLAAQNEARLEDERKYIAREVHDELGQVLTGLRMELSLMKMRFGALDPQIDAKVVEMKQLVDRAILGVRNVVVNLRPPALDMGLAAAVAWLGDEFTRKTGIPCRIDADEGQFELDEARAAVAFRIVQESLTNVMRYAGARQVGISLRVADGHLELAVRDDGCGFDPDAAAGRQTFGLLGMRERAMALGGRVDIDSGSGRGTVIGLTIPLGAEMAGAAL